MVLQDYVTRHERVELNMKYAVRENQRLAAKHLSKILKYVKKSDHVPVHIFRVKILDMLKEMYDDVFESIVDFGEDSIIDNISWESTVHEINVNTVDEFASKLFGSALITKHSLKNWLLKARFKDADKIMSIVRVAAIDDIEKDELEKRVISYYKNPLNTIRSLMDAVAFSSLFIVRDAFIRKNDIELIQWISVLDKSTTSGCIERSGLVYTAKGKRPYGHDVQWKEPGVYHWGCRSFIIPYK